MVPETIATIFSANASGGGARQIEPYERRPNDRIVNLPSGIVEGAQWNLTHAATRGSITRPVARVFI